MSLGSAFSSCSGWLNVFELTRWLKTLPHFWRHMKIIEQLTASIDSSSIWIIQTLQSLIFFFSEPLLSFSVFLFINFLSPPRRRCPTSTWSWSPTQEHLPQWLYSLMATMRHKRSGLTNISINSGLKVWMILESINSILLLHNFIKDTNKGPKQNNKTSLKDLRQ